jgi:hypothetical protein
VITQRTPQHALKATPADRQPRVAQGEVVVAHLGHPWCEAPLQPGTPLNLIADISRPPGGGEAECRLDHTQGLMVLHPDVLLSGGAGGRGGAWQ